MRKVLYVFGLLTDTDVDWMARVGVRIRAKDGEVRSKQDKPTDLIILLLEGQFLVTVKNVGVVARLGVGEIVGEMSLVDLAPPFLQPLPPRASVGSVAEQEYPLRRSIWMRAFGCRFYKALAVFLADRLRQMGQRSNANEELDLAGDTISKDELDPAILDSVSMAGERFDRFLKVLGVS